MSKVKGKTSNTPRKEHTPVYRTIKILPERLEFDKDHPFTRIHNNILRCDEIGTYEKLLYIILEMHMGNNAFAYPKVDTLADYMGCSRSQAYKSLEILQANGLILKDDNVYLNDSSTTTSTIYRTYHIEQLTTTLDDKKLPLRDKDNPTKCDIPLNRTLLKRVANATKRRIDMKKLIKDYPNDRVFIEQIFDLIIECLNSVDSHLGGTPVQIAKGYIDNLNYEKMKQFFAVILPMTRDTDFEYEAKKDFFVRKLLSTRQVSPDKQNYQNLSTLPHLITGITDVDQAKDDILKKFTEKAEQ